MEFSGVFFNEKKEIYSIVMKFNVCFFLIKKEIYHIVMEFSGGGGLNEKRRFSYFHGV